MQVNSLDYGRQDGEQAQFSVFATQFVLNEWVGAAALSRQEQSSPLFVPHLLSFLSRQAFAALNILRVRYVSVGVPIRNLLRNQNNRRGDLRRHTGTSSVTSIMHRSRFGRKPRFIAAIFQQIVYREYNKEVKKAVSAINFICAASAADVEWLHDGLFLPPAIPPVNPPAVAHG